MTDRELLELAAKSTGDFVPAPESERIADHLPVVFTYLGKPWNPLADDGDALRLAVKLSLNLSLSDCGEVHVDGIGTVIEKFGVGDPYVATRRAIVRAAAEIGRAMQ